MLMDCFMFWMIPLNIATQGLLDRANCHHLELFQKKLLIKKYIISGFVQGTCSRLQCLKIELED